jgi:hypothetical protein
MVRPRTASSQSSSDARPSHLFEAPSNPGMMAAASGGVLTSNDANMLAVTTASLRGARCVVPGCGRPREDPIHFPADDQVAGSESA